MGRPRTSNFGGPSPSRPYVSARAPMVYLYRTLGVCLNVALHLISSLSVTVHVQPFFGRGSNANAAVIR